METQIELGTIILGKFSQKYCAGFVAEFCENNRVDCVWFQDGRSTEKSIKELLVPTAQSLENPPNNYSNVKKQLIEARYWLRFECPQRFECLSRKFPKNDENAYNSSDEEQHDEIFFIIDGARRAMKQNNPNAIWSRIDVAEHQLKKALELIQAEKQASNSKEEALEEKLMAARRLADNQKIIINHVQDELIAARAIAQEQVKHEKKLCEEHAAARAKDAEIIAKLKSELNEKSALVEEGKKKLEEGKKKLEEEKKLVKVTKSKLAEALGIIERDREAFEKERREIFAIVSEKQLAELRLFTKSKSSDDLNGTRQN